MIRLLMTAGAFVLGLLVAPVATQATQADGSNAGYDLVIENGIIGITHVQATFRVPHDSGPDDLILVVDDASLFTVAREVERLERPVLAELVGANVSIWLRARSGCPLLYGHVVGSTTRVYVLPASRFGS